MRRFTRFASISGALLVGALLLPSQAAAQAIITNGTGIYLGVDLLGQLNVPDGTSGVDLTPTNSSFIGLYAAAIDGDATSPGCLCEGFGIAADGISGYANNDSGISNLTSVSFASDAATAVAVAEMTSKPGFTVTQDYHASLSADLMENTVTLTNGTAGTLTDVRYNRTMDWDIPPTTFDEFVTIGGWPATALLNSCDDGFQNPDPMVDSGCFDGANHNVNFVDAGPLDHGARFTFGFGDLDPGETKTFKIFYGASESEALAFAALGTVGAEVYSFGQCNPASDGTGTCSETLGTPMTFIFAFKGVGGTEVPRVPEPASLMLVGGGIIGALTRRYRARFSKS